MCQKYPNPTEMQDIISYTFRYILEDDVQMTRDTTISLLFKLREVSTSWREVADHIKKQIKSLSLLPLPSIRDSNYFFCDWSHAKLFRIKRSSYLGSMYSRFFKRYGSIKNEKNLKNFLTFYPNIHYLSIVELNTFILEHINNYWPNLKALAFEYCNVTDEQLLNCKFRSKLKIISFGAKVTEDIINLIITFFPYLEVIHFISYSRNSFGTKRINLNFLNNIKSTNITSVYFGNRLVSLKLPLKLNNNNNFVLHETHNNQRQYYSSSSTASAGAIEAIEFLQCDCEQINPLINYILPQFTQLKKLSLDVCNINNVSVLKVLGQLINLQYLGLNLPHGLRIKGDRIPLKEILNCNCNLNTLVLTGHYEGPVIEDIQLYDLIYCQNLSYICIYPIIPTSVAGKVDYIEVFSKFNNLQVLHIDYFPLSQPLNSEIRENFYAKIGCKLKSFNMICWCCMRRDYGCCDPDRKEPYVIHQRLCYCMFNPPDTFLAII